MTFGDVLNLAIEKSKGQDDVFVRYMPHIGYIEILIYAGKWLTCTNKPFSIFADIEKITPEECEDLIHKHTSKNSASCDKEEHF